MTVGKQYWSCKVSPNRTPARIEKVSVCIPPVIGLWLADKGGSYRLPFMHCGQTILSAAESQHMTHFKVSLRGKHKGTREKHEISSILHVNCISRTIEFHEVAIDAFFRSKIFFPF